MKEFSFTENDAKQFFDDGYFIIEGFSSNEQCDKLRKECSRLVDEMNPEEHQVAFSTTTHQHINNDYFLTSADKIRYFWEKDAQDEDGKINRPKHLALNKIGHALHWLSPPFKEFTFDEKIKIILRKLKFVRPIIPQSMYIFKQPHIGGEVNTHIDGTYLYSDPLKLIGLWIALEDVTMDNSCMWFAKGSHKTANTNYRFVRNPVEGAYPFTMHEGEFDDISEDSFTPVPVKKGTLVLIDGKVYHRSKKNLSDQSRHIYTFHVTDTHNCVWSKQNWMQETENYKFPVIYDESKTF